jgi:probable 2-oxoglutarate dehydrogenase E1 component DHKTD1
LIDISTSLEYGASKPLNVSFLPNPSHLEAVNPVAAGKTRAKQTCFEESRGEPELIPGDTALCLQIHGDAAFSGQVINDLSRIYEEETNICSGSSYGDISHE